jgi:hypothetical protein
MDMCLQARESGIETNIKQKQRNTHHHQEDSSLNPNCACGTFTCPASGFQLDMDVYADRICTALDHGVWRCVMKSNVILF